jgi:hypothetical protein
VESTNTNLTSRRGVIAFVAFMFLLVAISGLVSGASVFRGASTQSGDERKVNVHTFTRMPLTVKEVRNLQNDVPLKPGETYIFKIPEARVVGFEYMNREKNLPPQAWKRMEVSFNIISLSDGTGYEGGRRMLHSKKKSDGGGM